MTENLQWPSKLFPHCNHLLDISSDPLSFFSDDLPELPSCLVDLDSSGAKVSLDSANSDQDEQPPDIELIFQLILAGVSSDGLKY